MQQWNINKRRRFINSLQQGAYASQGSENRGKTVQAFIGNLANDLQVFLEDAFTAELV